MRHRAIFLFFTLLLAALFPARHAHAQVEVIDTSVEYEFGNHITFQAVVTSEEPIETAFIFIQAEGDTHTSVGFATITPLGEDSYKLTYVHKLADYPFRTFSWVDYYFEVVPKGKSKITSPRADFFYEDTRFDWQVLEEAPFKVHWYEGDVAFAQNALDVAQEGLDRVQDLLLYPAPSNLDIYIYPDPGTLQSTLNPNSKNWIAGHADPDLGVIVVALPPGPEQRLLMEQRIPHELMHVLLYQDTGQGYTNLPTWLNEGLASITELYPNPDYSILLESSIRRGSLLPISSLCDSFPREASTALLSYAQSASFVRYLYDTYGTSGLYELVETYANGVDCERGAKVALGQELSQLERQWRRGALSENILLMAINNLLPWLILFIAAMAVPIALAVSKARRKSTPQAASQTGGP
jgi:hypothetical protein